MPFGIMMRLITGCLIAIIVSIVFEWIGLTFWWKNSPHHAYEMFTYEYDALGSTFKDSVAGINPVKIITKTMMTVHSWLFDSRVSHGIKAWWISPTDSSVGKTIRNLINNSLIYIEATSYIVLTIVMRVVIFLLSMPWFLLCAITGLVNGGVEREIRKFEGGIEHGFIHHIARSHLPLAITITWILYLSIPVAIHPAWILIPGGLLFGYAIYVTTWSFKKYL